MRKKESESAREKRIETEATEWVAKKFRGFSPAEQDEFFEWLAADPAHSEAFVSYQELWGKMDTLAEWMPEHSEKPHRDLLVDRDRVYKWVWLGGLAAVLALGFMLLLSDSIGLRDNEQRNYVANAYESHELSDGSVVEMKSGAAMHVDFSPEFRRVELVSSEALFNVAKDPDRPFIVSAKGVDVVAVGTAFNVRVSDSEIEVLVTEGKVRLDAKPSAVAIGAPNPATKPIVSGLVAGQSSVVDLESGQYEVTVEQEPEESILEKLAWKYKLEFDSIPLFQAVEEINQRGSVHLEIADEAIRDLPLVAALRIDKIDHFVELLEISLGIEAVYVEEGRVLLKQGQGE
ncbi:FecR family protein [Pelagicoccus mobilis]|uniref:FecR domain-containing protein n=1 Tax=Pelagicoccus mobilis TaxID=415221 RepID=A0A934VNK0_9BACT|nr:FecR domain-containing protein [Pelagicoccus mobilis]MBK1880026.1 FecR domain-containing protein [Pelagicoccus mobilis]